MEKPRQIVNEPAPTGSAARRGAKLALIGVLTVALVAVLVHAFGGAKAFFSAVAGARADWVCASVAAALGCVLLSAVRWRLVLSAMGYRLSYRRTLGVVLSVWPLVVVTPSRTNEFLRALAIRQQVPLASGAGSVLAEKAVDVFVLLALACTGAMLHRLWLLGGLVALGMALELAVVWAVMKNRRRLAALPVFRKRMDRVEQLFSAFGSLRRAPLKLAVLGGVSLTIRVLAITVTYTLLVAVGAHVGWLDTLTLWPVATLVGLVPVTVAGMGTRDGAFIYLLQASGAVLDRASVLAATMGYSVVAVWLFALVGLPFMLREATLRGAARA